MRLKGRKGNVPNERSFENEIIKEKILNASESFKMPCRLGLIAIVKYKPKTYT